MRLRTVTRENVEVEEGVMVAERSYFFLFLRSGFDQENIKMVLCGVEAGGGVAGER